MTAIDIIRAKAERSGQLAQAHRKTHEAARLITPAATTVELARAENTLREAADLVETVRREILTAELRECAS